MGGPAWEVEEFYCAAAGWGVWVGISTRISGCDASEQRSGRWPAASMYRYGRWHEPRTKPCCLRLPGKLGYGEWGNPSTARIMYVHPSIRHEVGRGTGTGDRGRQAPVRSLLLISSPATCVFKQKQKTRRTRSQLGPIDTGAGSRKPRKSPGRLRKCPEIPASRRNNIFNLCGGL